MKSSEYRLTRPPCSELKGSSMIGQPSARSSETREASLPILWVFRASAFVRASPARRICRSRPRWVCLKSAAISATPKRGAATAHDELTHGHDARAFRMLIE